MTSLEEQILRTSKEIVVKFIELGRISPNGFREIFLDIYQTVKDAVSEPHSSDDRNQPPSS